MFGICRLRWHRENGLMNKYKRRWFPTKPICEGGARGFTIVGLQEVKPALFLLLYGNLFAFILMCLEILIRKTLIWYKDKKYSDRWAFGRNQWHTNIVSIRNSHGKSRSNSFEQVQY